MQVTDQLRRSYPYLALSRERGLEYGDVLSFADGLRSPEPSVWAQRAAARLTEADRVAVANLDWSLLGPVAD